MKLEKNFSIMRQGLIPNKEIRVTSDHISFQNQTELLMKHELETFSQSINYLNILKISHIMMLVIITQQYVFKTAASTTVVNGATASHIFNYL